MEKDIFEIAKQLPNTSKMISDLQNLKETVDNILQYVNNVDDENRKLKSEMIDLYKKLNISDVRNNKINELSSRENELFTKMTNTIFEIMVEDYLTKDEIINWIKVHIDENLIH
jgi:DNA-binding transcriptional regulator GbsR (MarR family)